MAEMLPIIKKYLDCYRKSILKAYNDGQYELAWDLLRRLNKLVPDS